eukprot:gnl/TRDRNA2_/TRDRNA2_152685_c0_seq2.p1 gnl/TRDRNA2_/TRDRNA2_152685_c0~~gnl/TRDRNA2_/TRDRNA2_152685_c0_seq2.p1  ORF type:complete len:439 (-),score=79.81 gnl/TRDRNA2_/TRDRNA2_152685_c0_seq2:30-1346(-)
MLNSLMEEAFKKIHQWIPQNLTAFSWAFAALTFRSRKLMEAISKEVSKKISAYEAQDLSNTSWAYARLAIIHYDMLNSISEDVLKKISLFTPQNLTNTAWSWATLAVCDVPLMAATSAEAIKKCQHFSAQNMGNTAWSFATCSVEDQPLLDAISAEAIRNIAAYDLQALIWVADFDLHCHSELVKLLEAEVAQVWKHFPTSPEGIDVSFSVYLKQLQIDNLGAIGSRLLLNHMGIMVADETLQMRALETIALYRHDDPREDANEMTFGGPTRHKRVFSYAEYQIFGSFITSEGQQLEGAMLQENGARGPHFEETPLRAVPLPINQRVDRNACSEFLLLSELCAIFSEAGVVSESERLATVGTLRLFSTGPSCLSCCAAIWQFCLRFPGVRMEVGFSKVQITPLISLRQVGSDPEVNQTVPGDSRSAAVTPELEEVREW